MMSLIASALEASAVDKDVIVLRITTVKGDNWLTNK